MKEPAAGDYVKKWVWQTIYWAMDNGSRMAIAPFLFYL